MEMAIFFSTIVVIVMLLVIFIILHSLRYTLFGVVLITCVVAIGTWTVSQIYSKVPAMMVSTIVK